MNSPEFFKIISAECGYATVRTDGTLGFDTPLGERVINPHLPSGFKVISAHAPSKVEIELSTAAEVFGFLNVTANSGQPVIFTVNDNPIGMASGPLQQTEVIRLSAGQHLLKTTTTRADCRHSVWAVKPLEENVSSRLGVVTVACYPEREAWQQLWHLCQSLLRLDMKAHVMGVGTEYGNHTQAKVIRLYEFISAIEADYILLTDCRDSFIIGSAEEIISEFTQFNADFVVSMERGCWPVFDAEWRDAFPQVHDNRNWPNGGGWMGTKAGVLRVLGECKKLATNIATGDLTGLAKRWERVLRGRGHDDQLLLQVLYLSGEIAADKDCRIFTNFGTANPSLENGDYEIADKRVVVRATAARPQVIHFSGGACAEARDQWAAMLGIC